MINTINNAPIISGAIKSLLHIHDQRTFPTFAKPFTSERQITTTNGTADVFLWADTFNNYFHPSTMRAAHKVLANAGFRVHLPQQHLCCGRPLYDFGMLDTAKKYLLKVLDVLAPQLENGTPIIVLEPSCASVFRDELTNLLPHDPRALKLRTQTFLLSEFLIKHAPAYRAPQLDAQIIVHGHCHHRATMGMTDEMTLLRATGSHVELLDSGCCGMAGPFGFEKDKFDLSQKLAERVLLPAVRKAATQTIIVSDGFSCCEQVVQNTGIRPLHLAEVLAQSSH